jgi:hypothetical protein
MKRLAAILRALFRRPCPHDALGWPRKRDGVDVCVCTACGQTVVSRIQFGKEVMVKIER